MSKTNAKSEFLNHIYNRVVLCAQIERGDNYYDADEEIIERNFILTTGYNEEDWNNFLSKIDFVYDSGYGSQELFCTIWYADGTWSDRGEYDGSEWYQYHKCPDIPDYIRRIDKEREQKLNQII
jgi:hypothetical protein